jgi:hypothetical protein
MIWLRTLATGMLIALPTRVASRISKVRSGLMPSFAIAAAPACTTTSVISKMITAANRKGTVNGQ